ncbi:YdcF family protein [Almyronema epifaneia]|uniref:YdcF family protein n=1 Tax=Almyronema epifaneia S1 TaxID=2991925 RepID=A0ABW6IBS7_9CYAN
MFVFLSKLLPLFVYPLGLACLLLLSALILLWRRPRWAAAAIALALLLLSLGGNRWVADSLVRSLEWRYLPAAELPTAEAIVVLGGSVYPAIPPRPWVEVSEAGDRVIYGARLFLAGKAPVLILSGGRIDWKDGGPPESADMAKLARMLGVPNQAIFEDPTSLNTYENAVNVKRILQAQRINRVLLVTSAIHMPRSLLIFQKQNIEAIPAPVDFVITEQTLQENSTTPEGRVLSLIPDAEPLEYLTRALKEYIGMGVYRLKGWL